MPNLTASLKGQKILVHEYREGRGFCGILVSWPGHGDDTQWYWAHQELPEEIVQKVINCIRTGEAMDWDIEVITGHSGN